MNKKHTILTGVQGTCHDENNWTKSELRENVITCVVVLTIVLFFILTPWGVR